MKTIATNISSANWLLAQEAKGLLSRISRLKSFALTIPAVPAANVSAKAQTSIEYLLSRGINNLRGMVMEFVYWLSSEQGRLAAPSLCQKKFIFLKLRFNSIISQFDIFQDVLSQRSQHETGIWIAGLDDVAADALQLPGNFYKAPAVICYLDRGHGASIRRVRTRLPGGELNPVAIIKIPHERMVGSGIASSLVHEVGHQGAALLDLVQSFKFAIQKESTLSRDPLVWRIWERWISEILADFWSVARVGVSATLGLMSVVSLPRTFVFRMDLEDPHPTPWIRVKLSCAMGEALYPHTQWRKISSIWNLFYPPNDLPKEALTMLVRLEQAIPNFVRFLINHRPTKLRGQSLKEVMPVEHLQPDRLRNIYTNLISKSGAMRLTRPSVAFAAIGQARADNKISPEQEGVVLSNLLTYWAMKSSLDTTARCANISHRMDQKL